MVRTVYLSYCRNTNEYEFKRKLIPSGCVYVYCMFKVLLVLGDFTVCILVHRSSFASCEQRPRVHTVLVLPHMT